MTKPIYKRVCPGHYVTTNGSRNFHIKRELSQQTNRKTETVWTVYGPSGVCDFSQETLKEAKEIVERRIILLGPPPINDPVELNKRALDITRPDHVQIQIREDGKVMWVNVNGVCVLRCCRIRYLIVEDNRKL